MFFYETVSKAWAPYALSKRKMIFWASKKILQKLLALICYFIYLFIKILFSFQSLVDDSSTCRFVREVTKSWLSSRLQVLTTSCLFVASFFTITVQQQVSPVIFGLTFVYIFQLPNVVETCIKYLIKTDRCFINVQNIHEYLQVRNRMIILFLF